MQPQRHRGTEAHVAIWHGATSWPLCSLCLCGLILFFIRNANAAWVIPISNSNFEQARGDGLPFDWEPVVFWSNAKFSAERANPHGGHSAIRIDAEPHAQAYLRMAVPVSVFPNEILEAGAWVKLQNVPADQCATIVAEFINTEGQTNDFARFVNIPGNSAAAHGWTYFQGAIKAPPMAARMRLRLGFWDGQGTAFFDDVSLASLTPVSCHIDLPWGRLTPYVPILNVEVLNRDQTPINVTTQVTMGKDITGDSRQQVIATGRETIRIPINVSHRGSYPLKVELFDYKHNVVAGDSRTVTLPPAIVMSPPIPTAWAVEDGPAHITGDIHLALDASAMGSAKIRVRLLDAARRSRADWTPRGDVFFRNPDFIGSTQYELKAKELPVGTYTIATDMDIPGQPSEHLEQPFRILPRRLASSSINSKGYLLYDNQPIFPLGVFNGDAHLSEMKSAGFTITHAYNACDVTEDPQFDDTPALNFLDSTEKAGLKAIFLIPRTYVFNHDWAAFRRRIRMFRNHPALIAWDEEEGIARGDMSLDDLKKMEQIIRSEDPYHPILVGDSRDEIEKIKDRSHFFPAEQMDLGMWWWYPFPLQNRTSLLNGDEGPSTSELIPPLFLTANTTGKPIWLGLQAYNKQGENPAFKTARYPTPTEYRAQAFISIISGAKGLMWYGGSVAGGVYENPTAGHWNDLKKLVAELHGMIPVFLSPTAASPPFDPAAAPLCVMRKHTPSGDVLFAANRAGQSVDVTFHLGAKNMPAHFKPYAVRVYRLP